MIAPRRSAGVWSARAAICVVGLVAAPPWASACPFCGTPPATLSARRAAAAWSGWGELVGRDAQTLTIEIRQQWHGPDLENPLQIPAAGSTARVGALLLVLGNVAAEAPPDSAKLSWEVETLSELRLAYLVRAPEPARSIVERLEYYAAFLEHDDPWLAADAFGEFAVAPLSAVEQVSSRFDLPRLAGWIDDPAVRPERKGLYGLLLALVGRERDPARAAAVLERAMLAEASDFRGGFSGIVAGYLWSAGPRGLDTVARAFVDAPRPREGDLRHVLAALAFYHEQVPDASSDIEALVRRLLVRCTLAPEAIGMLGRWRSLDSLAAVVELYGRGDYPQPATRRAVVGFLAELGGPPAQAALDALRSGDSAGVEEALRYWAERPADR